MKKNIIHYLTIIFLLLIVLCVFFACHNIKAKNADNTALPSSEVSETEENTDVVDFTGDPTPLPTQIPLDTIVVDPYTVYTSDLCDRDVALLSQTYSQIVNVEVIGKSNGENNINLIKLGKGQKKILITASTHGRENITTTYIMRCVDEYAKAYLTTGNYNGIDVKTLLNAYTVYVVPMNNPDGVDIVNGSFEPLLTSDYNSYAKLTWKANGRGVDLNRNFPFFWQEMSLAEKTFTVPGKMSFPGSEAYSEPETQALMTLCYKNSFEFCINLHTKGKLIYWRDDGNGVIGGDEKLADLLKNQLGFEKKGSTSSVASYGGGFENWFRSAFSKPAVCLEMTSSGDGDIPFNLVTRSNYKDSTAYDNISLTDIYNSIVLDWDKSSTLTLVLLRDYFS